MNDALLLYSFMHCKLIYSFICPTITKQEQKDKLKVEALNLSLCMKSILQKLFSWKKFLLTNVLEFS